MADKPKFLHRVYGLSAFALGVVYWPCALLWASCSPSSFGWVVIAAGFLGWLGLVLGSRGLTGPIFSVAAILIAASSMGIHHVMANSSKSAYIRAFDDPSVISSVQLLPEHDIAVVGARILDVVGYFAKRGETLNIGMMSNTYRDTFPKHTAVPSPFFRSSKVAANGRSFDMLVFEPDEFKGKAIIFLHGYGGNWALPCGMVAKSANEQGFRVYCPTLDLRADWTTPTGRKIVGKLLGRLKSEGIEKVVLGGISNGAVGASVMARQYSIDWVLLISGVAKNAVSGGKNYLIFQGKDDTMAPLSKALAYVEAGKKRGKLHKFEGGHFAVLNHRDAFWTDLDHWLRQI